MKLTDNQIELASATFRGFLYCRRTSKRLRDAWSQRCDVAERPLIEMVAQDPGVTKWRVFYDLILTGATMTQCEMRAFADLLDNVGVEGYLLGEVYGHTRSVSLADAELIAQATVIILDAAVERCRNAKRYIQYVVPRQTDTRDSGGDRGSDRPYFKLQTELRRSRD
jgi:hypothetical protein